MSKRPDIGFIACQILDFFNRDRLDSAGDIITRAGLPLKRGSDQSADGRFQEPCEVLSASAGAAFYRREAFERVGSFDAGYFMYLEDVDWSLRAALLGIRCFYVPQAKVYHIEGGSDPERAVFLERGETQRRIFHTRERTYWITRNRVRLLVKNYPTTLLIRIAPWILFGFARSALFHLIKTGLFSSYIRGLMRGLSEIPQCMTLRRSIQQNRKLTTTQFAGILFASQQ
jgi:GT2 family glycosyltransferase